MKARILVIDDDKDICELIDHHLSKMGYVVTVIHHARKAIKTIKKEKIDLVILDINLPDIDGIELCTSIREQSELADVLIAFLTGSTETFTHIAALDAGGDDFIPKPIKLSTFKSRIKAMLRRHKRFQEQNQSDVLEVDHIKIDNDNMIVTIDGEVVHFPKKEFRLLKLLVSSPGRVFKREELRNVLWKKDVKSSTRTVDVHIRKLRKKIGKKRIETYKGEGYKYVVD